MSRTWWRRGLAGAFAIIAAACGAFSNPIVENAGNELPSGMRLPRLSGDAETTADQICDWVAANQIPFLPSLADRAFFENVVGPDHGRYEVNGLLNVFLQRERGGQLVLPIDANTYLAPQTGAEAVYALIEGPGLHAFEKVPLEHCALSSAPFATSHYDRLQLCVSVNRVESAPHGSTRADYRDLYYQVSVGPMRMQQPVHMRVVTLSDQDGVKGRYVSARLWGGPLDLGRVNRFCGPVGAGDPFGVHS